MGCDYDRATNTNTNLIVARNSNLFFSHRLGFTGSSNKEGAWQFIRTFLTEEYQMENTWRLPVNLNALKASAEARIGSAFIQAEGSAVTGEYVYNAFLKLVESAERVATPDAGIQEIAKNTCSGFYRGEDSDYGAAEKFGTAVLEYLNK